MLATLSNCGELLKLSVLTYKSDFVRAKNNGFGYSKNLKDIWMSAQPSSVMIQNAVQRLNVSGSFYKRLKI